MQSQNSRYHANFLPFSESGIVISYCYHLLLKELQTHQMQKWLTQAAIRTTIDYIIDFSEYSSSNGKQDNWTNKPEIRHQESRQSQKKNCSIWQEFGKNNL
jgi:hypothetical protein